MLSRCLRAVGVVLTVPLLAAAVGCGKSNNPTGSTGGNSQVGGVPSDGPTTPNTVITTAPPPSPTGTGQAARYPADAKTYASELLKAWINKQAIRIEELADSSTQAQLKDAATYGGYPANTQWTSIRCASGEIAGTTNCIQRNGHGDESVITLVTAKLGHPQAVSAANLERTQYPSMPTAYVDEFLGAWASGNLQRMARLSSSTIANKFAGYNAITSKTTYDMPNDATTVKVKVDGSGGDLGRSAEFTVLTSPGGKANAIKSGTCANNCA
jgi:hypothetical protein